MYKILSTHIFVCVVYVGYCRVFWSNNFNTNIYTYVQGAFKSSRDF